MSDLPSYDPPINAPIHGSEPPSGERGRFLSFADVEERLVEALITCCRHGDRERGWLSVRSGWPEVLREVAAGDYDARGGDGTSSDVAIRPASLTRREVAEMEEAFGWLEAVSPDDRRLVALAIAELARGRREVSWVRLLRRLGLRHGSDGLRKRYGRAITAMCERANPQKSTGGAVNGVKLQDPK